MNNDVNSVRISYRSAMIHFSMSVKQIEDALEEWLKKFEDFFKRIPGVYEVNVDIHCLYSDNYRNGCLNYYWKKNTDRDGISTWKYKGDPTKIEDICNPINYTHSFLTDELKNEIIANMQWVASQIGKNIIITDKLTTIRGNYDRHFTRTCRFETKLKEFGIRVSGAIGMLKGDNVEFEFKSDSIRRIERTVDELEIELFLDLNTSRIITLKIKDLGKDDN